MFDIDNLDDWTPAEWENSIPVPEDSDWDAADFEDVDSSEDDYEPDYLNDQDDFDDAMLDLLFETE